MDHPTAQRSEASIYYVGKFYILIIVVYDLVLIPKSSITADTAFRKDLSLQGCTTLPTRANRLLTPLYTPFLREATEGGRLHSIHAQIYP